MSDLPAVTHAIDSDGVGWITFDDPAARANVFNRPTQAALGAALAALAQVSSPQLKAVVLLSGKEKIFIAGADLKWLATLPDAAAATVAAREGQALFNRIATFRVPVVAAIHGACAGGGYELALACTWRIASHAPETRIGLPEVGIGLIPGWGGCTRLPRLVGVPAAVEHILKAALIPAPAALKAGLVDEEVPAAELKARAKAAALRLAAGISARPSWPAATPEYFATQRSQAGARRRGQPAPLVVLDVIEKSSGLALSEALEIEATHFGQIAAGEVAKNLIHVFLLKESGRKASADAWLPKSGTDAAPAPFRTIGIIGAGVMGSGIAHWCASHGFGVILCDSSREAIERGVTVIRGLFADSVARGQLTTEKAHRMTGGIGITTTLEDFEICDLVIEAIVEDVGAKQKLLAELSKAIGPDCLVASNTSALPIEELAVGVANPRRVLGIHFFNPVGRMPLVELVLSPQTTRETADRALAFVKALGKTPVICRSSPGFFVTRVLFFYLNEACLLWELGFGTETIDRAMQEWGWPMGPMRLIDEVGIDVTDFIFREMDHYYAGRFSGSSLCRRMLGAGWKGRKNGTSAGFYDYAAGAEKPNPGVAKLAPEVAPAAWDAEKIQKHLNGVMIEETKRVLAEGVLKTPDEADLALLLGAGFPAFRGGLMRYARAMDASRS